MLFAQKSCFVAVLLSAPLALLAPFSRASALRDDSFGSWSPGQTAPDFLLATHAILLRNNKILVVGGSSYNCCFRWGKEEARLYDVASGTWGNKMPSPAPYGPNKDAFCGGHTHDDGGNVIFQGGLLGYGNQNGTGIDNAARYDVSTGVWKQLGAASAHWYPTLLPGVRHTFLFPGRATGGDNHVRKLAYGASTWIDTGSVHTAKSTYPRAVLLPNGKIFIASPADAVPGQQERKNYLYDPAANTFTLAGTDLVPETGVGGHHGGNAWDSSGVLLPLIPSDGDYPSVKYALIDGEQAYVKELAVSNPAWQPTGPRPAELGTPSPHRYFANTTLLPTGQVLVTGGVRVKNNDNTAVKEVEVYDPPSNSWFVGSPATVPRNYHGVALLLPDGRVWTASSSQNEQGSECANVPDGCEKPSDGKPENSEQRVEIFTPWYVGRSDRPVITSCPAKMSTDGGHYTIGIGNSQGTNIGRVVLMRPGSVTHSFDGDQRVVQLDIIANNASSVVVAAPYGAPAAAPGDYMLFASRATNARTGFQRWVPSVACWTRVEPQAARHDIPAANYQSVFTAIASQGYRPVWVDGFEVAGGHRFNVVFTAADINWVARHDLDGAAYQKEFDTHAKNGFRLANVDSYLVGGQVRYAAIWERRRGPEFTAYHGVPAATHQTNFNSLVKQGFRPVNISVVNVGGQRFVTALYDKAAVGSFVALAGLTEAEYQTEFNSQVKQGRRLAYVNAFMEGGVPRISAIWNQSPAGAWIARHGVTSAGYQTEYDNRIGEGLQTRAVAGYQTSGASRFIAFWTKK